MYYISAVSSVTHQPTFQNKGFSKSIVPLEGISELIQPSYKEFIDAGLLRRMSKILRMSVAAAVDSLRTSQLDQPDAIVVGTGLGCLLDTEKFLNNVLSLEGMIPPTSFIQSTHNTIAGQISLSLGNHGYNMTHTQNTLSFENALLDAFLLLGEGMEHVLVGAADEHIPFLDEVAEKLLIPELPLTSGASFFVVGKQQQNALAAIVDVEALGSVEDADIEIERFLARNGYTRRDITHFYFGGIQSADEELLVAENEHISKKNYLKFSGLYPTASAFGLHLALDCLQERSLTLVCNQIGGSRLGLILVKSIEA